ncbi:MAG TPA: hypothetical protein VF880_05520, partial [Actinomycetes bacterium]
MQSEHYRVMGARAEEGSRPRDGRRPRSLWAETFGAPMWRSVAYDLLSLPVGIASLLLALAGAHPAAARLQRGLADRWLRRPPTPPPGGDRWGRVVLQALLASTLGVVCWLLVALAGPNTVRNVLLYPITDGDSVARAWGGPTLAGAWAVHAAGALLLLPVELWLLRGLAGLQGRLAAQQLDGDRARWVLPVAVVVAALGLAWLRAFA